MVRLNRIYTRTGDDGTTGLVDGSRVPKDDGRIEAFGDVDEANAIIGLARLHAAQAPHGAEADAMLARIQNDLFDLGADLATPMEIEGALRIQPSQVERLEHEIDAMNGVLAPLTSFVLPGGKPMAAYLHLARTVARRAERRLVAFSRIAAVSPDSQHYLNRLSDYLFVLSRWVNDEGKTDVLWVPGAHR
ncbi:MAG TPA: cob(I)yrinic acid a,c-diamide adenosyltransferase [Stellaceae bacterium]|jgi:cob(I)alamin adenosyltransferase|nr:cob(I)yrinic acid a,c-diamide adenosyltransferase [Stellaceae bacterium]